MIKRENILAAPTYEGTIDLCSELSLNANNPGSLTCETSSTLPAEPEVGQTITFTTGSKTKINIDLVCDSLTVSAFTGNSCRNALSGLENPNGQGELTIFQDGTVSFKSATPFIGDGENVPLTTLQNELVENSTTIDPNLDKQYGLPLIGVVVTALLYSGIRSMVKEKIRVRNHNRRMGEIEGLRRETAKNRPHQIAQEEKENEETMTLLLANPPLTGLPFEALNRDPISIKTPPKYDISPETQQAIVKKKQQYRERDALLAKQ